MTRSRRGGGPQRIMVYSHGFNCSFGRFFLVLHGFHAAAKPPWRDPPMNPSNQSTICGVVPPQLRTPSCVKRREQGEVREEKRAGGGA